MIALWLAVDLDVSAVIGQRGTAAVLRRALVVMRRTHAWMSEPSDDTDFDACVHALSNVFASRAPEERVSGQHALETAFHDLLASLVGAPLAAQLLRAGWAERRARLEVVQ
jgi:DNA-binding GntR family transcriptional regulator